MNTWLISDTHFGHENILNFKRDDGTKLRDFSTVEEMDEAMIHNWNSVVGPKDRIYHLGDVVINRRALSTLSRLNGRKMLVKGNHDIFKADEYLEYFDDIKAYHVIDGLLLSHVPVHPDSLGRFGCNVHGHLHYREVVDANGVADLRYINVSVECINYTPISLEGLKWIIGGLGGSTQMKPNPYEAN
jgi:calcineurin-like phosphoesterase family protein